MAADKSPMDWALTPLKKYAQFSGRAPRAEYWWFYLFYIVAYVVAAILDGILGSIGIFTIIVMLGLLIPMIAAGVRRLHDTDRTGWWLLAPAVPYLGMIATMGPALLNPQGFATEGFGAMGGMMLLFMVIAFILGIVVFVFTVLPGTRGPNRYGADPYGEQENLEAVFS